MQVQYNGRLHLTHPLQMGNSHHGNTARGEHERQDLLTHRRELQPQEEFFLKVKKRDEDSVSWNSDIQKDFPIFILSVHTTVRSDAEERPSLNKERHDLREFGQL